MSNENNGGITTAVKIDQGFETSAANPWLREQEVKASADIRPPVTSVATPTDRIPRGPFDNLTM